MRKLGPWPLAYTLLRGVIAGYGILFALFILFCLLPLPQMRALQGKSWFRRAGAADHAGDWRGRSLVGHARQSSSAALPIGPVVLTYDGVWAEVTIFVVFLTLFACSILLTMTTSPIALDRGADTPAGTPTLHDNATSR